MGSRVAREAVPVRPTSHRLCCRAQAVSEARNHTVTEDLKFYHGTSASAAGSILRDGGRNHLEAIGALDLGKEIYHALLKYQTADNMSELFNRHDIEDGISPSISLQTVAENRSDNVFSYGDFYVSLGHHRAVKYALADASGSEFLAAIRHGLAVLAAERDPIGDRIVGRFPDVMALLHQQPRPVLIELSGIAPDRVTSEAGDPDILSSIEPAIGFQRHGGIVQLSFRILRVRPSDVKAVYDLQILLGSRDRDYVEDPIELTALDPIRFERGVGLRSDELGAEFS